MDKKEFSCVDCGTRACRFSDREHTPPFCMTIRCEEAGMDKCADQYSADPENSAVMNAAAEMKYETYSRLTRVEETVMLFKKLGVKKVGIATCTALVKESQVLAKILRKNGFEVISASCQIGMVKKAEIGIPEEVINEKNPNTCNPIMQAKVLNEAKTDYNILMGLCVGHDSMFYKYSDALVTTLVTKDRVTGHNAVMPLYTTHSFYKKLLTKSIEEIYEEERLR